MKVDVGQGIKRMNEARVCSSHVVESVRFRKTKKKRGENARSARRSDLLKVKVWMVISVSGHAFAYWHLYHRKGSSYMARAGYRQALPPCAGPPVLALFRPRARCRLTQTALISLISGADAGHDRPP